MSDKRRDGGHNDRRPVLLTEPVSQEPSGEDVPDDDVITEPVPQEPPTDG